MQNEIEHKEEALKSISRMLQVLIQDVSKEEVDQMMTVLKREKGMKYFHIVRIDFDAVF